MQLAYFTIESAPDEKLLDDEYEASLVKIFSYCFLLVDRKVNPIVVFSMLLNNPKFLDVYMRISELSTPQESYAEFIKNYPKICESKIVKDQITALRNGKKRRTGTSRKC